MDAERISRSWQEVGLEGLTGRREVIPDDGPTRAGVEGRSILVTGAAGFIGSELCRQLSRFSPRLLVLFDQSESELFRIEQELGRSYPKRHVVAILGDVRDIRSTDDVLGRHHIDAIYHAAAYKHLPMMERHAVEAVRNNVVGTWNLVRSAMRHGVGRLLMVSSDKAVRPSSVMGATKRVAELIVAGAGASGARFVSARCGNVLGSHGSVAPTFEAQIASGGPVTVTDPRAQRYFMSAREAALFLIESSRVGLGGDVFVPEMGEPVRILDLAHTMIRLAGLVPDQDVSVHVTGIRPGEKLREELVFEAEEVKRTDANGFRICRGPEVGTAEIEGALENLLSLIDLRDSDGIVEWLMALVPEFEPQGRTLERERPEPIDLARSRG